MEIAPFLVGKPDSVCLQFTSEVAGVSDTTARVLAGEIGLDRSRFPDGRPPDFMGWAVSQAPRERRQAPLGADPKGCAVAQDVADQRGEGGCANQAHLPPCPIARLKARRGARKAIVAVAASMLTAAFHIVRDRVVYRELGADHFTKRARAKAAKRLLKRLEGLGYAVEARPTTAVASI